jgi:hypothetical protein
MERVSAMARSHGYAVGHCLQSHDKNNGGRSKCRNRKTDGLSRDGQWMRPQTLVRPLFDI